MTEAGHDELGAELQKALTEHRELIAKLLRIEEMLEAAPKKAVSGTDIDWGGSLAEILGSLKNELRGHFAGEEGREGFYDGLPQQFPRFADRLKRLQEEHVRIVHAFAQCCKLAGALPPGDLGAAEEVVRRCRLAIATLRRHESEENEILQLAYCEDIGAVD